MGKKQDIREMLKKKVSTFVSFFVFEISPIDGTVPVAFERDKLVLGLGLELAHVALGLVGHLARDFGQAPSKEMGSATANMARANRFSIKPPKNNIEKILFLDTHPDRSVQ